MVEMKALALCSALTTIGCGSDVVYVEDFTVQGQDEAMAIVWNETYRRVDAAPHVRWIRGDMLTCIDEDTERPGFPIYVSSQRLCVRGRTWDENEIEVAWTGNDKFHDTSLAHESMHALQLRAGLVDANHQSPPFQPGGLVDQANAALSGRGF